MLLWGLNESPVMNHSAKEMNHNAKKKKEEEHIYIYMHVCITESVCFTVEINTTL